MSNGREMGSMSFVGTLDCELAIVIEKLIGWRVHFIDSSGLVD